LNVLDVATVTVTAIEKTSLGTEVGRVSRTINITAN